MAEGARAPGPRDFNWTVDALSVSRRQELDPRKPKAQCLLGFFCIQNLSFLVEFLVLFFRIDFTAATSRNQ